MPDAIPLEAALKGIAEAMLIGLLVGAQRETQEGVHPGIRDFLLIGLVGGICGLLRSIPLAVAALATIGVLLAVFHYEERRKRTGITTEMAAVATFGLGFLTASPGLSFGPPLAIGVTIAVVVFLEMKTFLQRLVRETISEGEFNDTLRFIAVALVVYPLLPPGSYGPYNAVTPRQVWMFIILVSSIAYIGYFLRRFLGEEKGLAYTSVLGGLASTMAVTLQFARASRRHPEDTHTYWWATVMANTVQFPRTLVILLLVNTDLALVSLPPLAAMLAAGIALSWLLARAERAAGKHQLSVGGNPFRLRPALQFGVLFLGIVFLSKVAAIRLGTGALYGTSALGGVVDPATVAASVSDLLAVKQISLSTAEAAVLVALLANAILKLTLAAAFGCRGFAWRMAASMGVLFGLGGLTWWFTAPTP